MIFYKTFNILVILHSVPYFYIEKYFNIFNVYL